MPLPTDQSIETKRNELLGRQRVRGPRHLLEYSLELFCRILYRERQRLHVLQTVIYKRVTPNNNLSPLSAPRLLDSTTRPAFLLGRIDPPFVFLYLFPIPHSPFPFPHSVLLTPTPSIIT